MLAERNGVAFYEPQNKALNERRCGAAALIMAYRNCGVEVDQQTVWSSIARQRRGEWSAHSNDIARDGLQRGLVAVVFQTHQPWRVLSVCWRNGISVIINHRLAFDSTEGHYSLLAGITADRIKLHDPLLGPGIEYACDEFLKLWLPSEFDSEISGYVLIAIDRVERQPMLWCHCNHLFPDSVQCESCGGKFPIKPVIALGCTHQACKERTWWRIFCPTCDRPLSQLR